MTPLRECDKCAGTGWTPSAKVTGGEMRAMREAAGVSGAWVADVMHMSRAYVSALELGERNWTPDLVASYQRALNKAKEAR
jgi:transcriptional regulator with XRE-family HTH domain